MFFNALADPDFKVEGTQHYFILNGVWKNWENEEKKEILKDQLFLYKENNILKHKFTKRFYDYPYLEDIEQTDYGDSVSFRFKFRENGYSIKPIFIKTSNEDDGEYYFYGQWKVKNIIDLLKEETIWLGSNFSYIATEKTIHRFTFILCNPHGNLNLPVCFYVLIEKKLEGKLEGKSDEKPIENYPIKYIFKLLNFRDPLRSKKCEACVVFNENSLQSIARFNLTWKQLIEDGYISETGFILMLFEIDHQMDSFPNNPLTLKELIENKETESEPKTIEDVMTQTFSCFIKMLLKVRTFESVVKELADEWKESHSNEMCAALYLNEKIEKNEKEFNDVHKYFGYLSYDDFPCSLTENFAKTVGEALRLKYSTVSKIDKEMQIIYKKDGKERKRYGITLHKKQLNGAKEKISDMIKNEVKEFDYLPKTLVFGIEMYKENEEHKGIYECLRDEIGIEIEKEITLTAKKIRTFAIYGEGKIVLNFSALVTGMEYLKKALNCFDVNYGENPEESFKLFDLRTNEEISLYKTLDDSNVFNRSRIFIAHKKENGDWTSIPEKTDNKDAIKSYEAEKFRFHSALIRDEFNEFRCETYYDLDKLKSEQKEKYTLCVIYTSSEKSYSNNVKIEKDRGMYDQIRIKVYTDSTISDDIKNKKELFTNSIELDFPNYANIKSLYDEMLKYNSQTEKIIELDDKIPTKLMQKSSEDKLSETTMVFFSISDENCIISNEKDGNYSLVFVTDSSNNFVATYFVDENSFEEIKSKYDEQKIYLKKSDGSETELSDFSYFPIQELPYIMLKLR